MTTYTIDGNLLAPSADALLMLDQFSQQVEIIAEAIKALSQQENILLINRLADMLVQLATNAQNCEGGRLCAYLCAVLDAGIKHTS